MRKTGEDEASYSGRTTTRTTTVKEIKYIHHHFFMCVLKRCHTVGLAAGAASAAFDSVVSELFSRSDFDMMRDFCLSSTSIVPMSIVYQSS